MSEAHFHFGCGLPKPQIYRPPVFKCKHFFATRVLHFPLGCAAPPGLHLSSYREPPVRSSLAAICPIFRPSRRLKWLKSIFNFLLGCYVFECCP